MTASTQAASPSLAHRLAAGLFDATPGVLRLDGHALTDLAERYGTPFFVYGAGSMRRSLDALRRATQGRFHVCYSAKANPNPAVLRVLLGEGAGIEVASAAEYEAARRAGAAPHDILMAGPAKGDAELEHVIARGLAELHLEAEDEIDRVAALAERRAAPVEVSLRINPASTAAGGSMQMGGRPTQFGIDEERLEAALARVTACPSLALKGLHLYAGTQILSADVLLRQWRHGVSLARTASRMIGRPLSTLDLGGGLGIPYAEQDGSLDLAEVEAGVARLLAEVDAAPELAGMRLIVEPGRWLAGPAGVYVARVISVKSSRGVCFAVTDGGMNHHLAASGNLGQVIKRDYPLLMANRPEAPHDQPVTVVGPLCTPLDTYGRQTRLPAPQIGDLIAVMQSGAYGLSASPVGFLSHPMPAELLVDGERVDLIRPRGSFAQPITLLP